GARPEPTRHLKHSSRRTPRPQRARAPNAPRPHAPRALTAPRPPYTEAPGDHRRPQWQGARSGRHGQRTFGPGLRASRIGAVEHGDAGGDRGREPDHMEVDEYLGHTE